MPYLSNDLSLLRSDDRFIAFKGRFYNPFSRLFGFGPRRLLKNFAKSIPQILSAKVFPGDLAITVAFAFDYQIDEGNICDGIPSFSVRV